MTIKIQKIRNRKTILKKYQKKNFLDVTNFVPKNMSGDKWKILLCVDI